MKRILVLIVLLLSFLIIIGGLGLSPLGNLFAFSFCDQPIHYRVDTVDSRFKISRDAFLADINQAAQIWSNIIGKNLFIYDPNGDLSINFIYDERQSLTNQINLLENKVQSEKQTLNPKLNEYQVLSLDFKQKIDSLNKEIEYWNSRGGAPPEEYNKIIQEQRDLQAEANNLNAMARSLNMATDTYNTQVNTLNQTITIFNYDLKQRPEEGIFKGPEQRIEIYFNITKQELIHTIAHELGHALGFKHSSNSAAIMYSKTTQQITPSDDDIAALKDICQKHTLFEFIQARLSQIRTASN